MSKRELETVKRADRILDQAREMIRESMGTEGFEADRLYTLEVYDLADSDECSIEWTTPKGAR